MEKLEIRLQVIQSNGPPGSRYVTERAQMSGTILVRPAWALEGLT
ncbi:hypothetical protein [Pseudomonas putida]|nr:hypothetical protein [Pseudomonas putida]MDP9521915.1 hypothetical protein [Pseudomonas putida]